MSKSKTENKKITLAKVACGFNEYEDRLWKLLNQFQKQYGNTRIYGYNHARLFSHILMAGATIQAKGNIGNPVEQHFVIQINESEKENFYRELFVLLSNEVK